MNYVRLIDPYELVDKLTAKDVGSKVVVVLTLLLVVPSVDKEPALLDTPMLV